MIGNRGSRRTKLMLPLLWRGSLLLPLAIFLSYASPTAAPSDPVWLRAYLLSGSLAGMLLIAISARAQTPDALTLGVNLYLLIGASAVLSGASWVLLRFEAMRESGVFLFALLVTLATAVMDHGATPSGPIRHTRSLQTRWDCVLAIGAFAFSLQFQGQHAASTWIPVAMLSAQRHWPHPSRRPR